jgi:hypothetical protein
MTEHTISLWTLTLTAAGIVIALASIFYAIKTLRDNGIIARAQFFATVRGLMAEYDDVHAKLRPEGAWAPPKGELYARTGPGTPEDWARVELYMGLFEYCEVLLRRGLMQQEDFDRSFRYRLQNLTRNAVIVDAKLLSDLKVSWADFLLLCDRCRVHLPSRQDISGATSA